MDVEPGQHRQTTRHQRGDPHKPPDHCVNRFGQLVGQP